MPEVALIEDSEESKLTCLIRGFFKERAKDHTLIVEVVRTNQDFGIVLFDLKNLYQYAKLDEKFRNFNAAWVYVNGSVFEFKSNGYDIVVGANFMYNSLK